MMAKKVSLSVHRNTIESRNKRLMAKEASADVEAMIRENDIRAYAFVGIGSDGRGFVTWDTGGIIPMWCFPEAIGALLASDMGNSGIAEDFKAPITGGTFKRAKA